VDPGKKVERLDRALTALDPHRRSCRLCPRDCGTDRQRGELGVCQSPDQAGVAKALLHFGEEPVLSGTGPAARGSGTIFFTGCNLKCLFCQNHQVSWSLRGRLVTDEELAGMMLDLQSRGAYNINLVSPSHLLLPILRSLRVAIAAGLRLPLVYNSHGYERVEVIERLAGIVDLFLPDCKYRTPALAARCSGAPDYFEFAGPTIQEMFVQQPDLDLDKEGIARRGTIVRHLVLPGQVDNTLAVLDWLAETFPRSLPLSLMSQYRPCFRAPSDLARSVSPEEYRTVVDRAQALGFEQLYLQPGLFGPDDHLNPDFDLDEPFPWKR
jgi:putative pyruvate formate lyase activating enzyme